MKIVNLVTDIVVKEVPLASNCHELRCVKVSPRPEYRWTAVDDLNEMIAVPEETVNVKILRIRSGIGEPKTRAELNGLDLPDGPPTELYVAVSENIQKYLRFPLDVLKKQIESQQREIQGHRHRIAELEGELWVYENLSFWQRLKWAVTGNVTYVTRRTSCGICGGRLDKRYGYCENESCPNGE